MRNRNLTLVALGCALCAGSPRPGFAEPAAAGFDVTVYADVPAPVSLSFDASGALFTGRDVPGDPGGGATVRIHRIGPGGAPVEEFGDAGIPDPDGALVDLDGSISGFAGAVLVCGAAAGGNGQLVAVKPDGTIVTVSAPSSVMQNPNYMARGRDGLLITDNCHNKVFEFNPPGPPTILIDSPASPLFIAQQPG